VRNLAVSGLVLVLVAGCSTISVDTDHDPDGDFANYRTFDWIPRSAMKVQDPEFNQLTDQRIRRAITAQLRAKGIEKADGETDLIVSYHGATRERAEVYTTGWSGYHGYGYWPGYGHSTVETRYYTEGTLMVDLIDAKRKQMVWRGKATGVVGDYESQEARISEAVEEMFKRYPPKMK